jgi:flagellar basal-body rod protein FlgB
VISGVTNGGAIPVLERMVQFSGQRQRLLANNIANLSTPDFRPVDVSVADFQQNLGEAIDARRAAHGNTGGELPLASTREVKVHAGGMALEAQPIGENILFHDGNDRDLDRTMQGLVENFMAFRTAAQFMRKQFETLHTAIAGRI